MTTNTESDRDELRRQMRLPARRWALVVGWGLTALALLLNLAHVPGIYRATRTIDQAIDAVLLFGSPCALGLALAFPLVPRLRHRPVARWGALLWLPLALVSVLSFPVSFLYAELSQYDTWFGAPLR